MRFGPPGNLGIRLLPPRLELNQFEFSCVLAGVPKCAKAAAGHVAGAGESRLD